MLRRGRRQGGDHRYRHQRGTGDGGCARQQPYRHRDGRTDPGAVERGIGKVVETYGRVDVLVSDADVQMVKRLEEFEYDEWRKVVAIHLDGAFLTSKAVLPHIYR